MGPSWDHAGLSFVEVLITLASKDLPTMFAGHVACAAWPTMPGKPENHLVPGILPCALALPRHARPSFGRALEPVAAAQTSGRFPFPPTTLRGRRHVPPSAVGMPSFPIPESGLHNGECEHFTRPSVNMLDASCWPCSLWIIDRAEVPGVCAM